MNLEYFTMSADYFHESNSASEAQHTENEIIGLMLAGDMAMIEKFDSLATFGSEHYGHYLYDKGISTPYRILDLIETFEPRLRKHFYLKILSSVEPLIPFDYQALAALGFLSAIKKGELTFNESDRRELLALRESYSPLALRSKQVMARIKTDGIDHLFPIPKTPEDRLEIVKYASQLKAEERRALVIERFFEGLGEFQSQSAVIESTMFSLQAEKMIQRDIQCSLIRPQDFYVPWTQILSTPEYGSLTLAEVSRITLLAPEFKLPDDAVRLALVGYYRSALRISGRAVIGLGSGIFHVEHGTLCEPSYFYMGRGAIMGKGCMIDGVGGALLLSESFIGGGFMPILIHTHKHVRAPGASAADERKRLLPCVFTIESGVRFPMSRIGLFETADYLGRAEADGIKGVRALSIESRVDGQASCVEIQL